MSRVCSIEGCGRKHFGKGYCHGHYQRSQRGADMVAPLRPHPGTKHGAPWAFIAEAAAYVGQDCLIWPFAKLQTGHAVVGRDGATVSAAALVMEAAGRPRPSPKHEVCHAPIICHNPPCVNPGHIRWGTRSENMADKKLDGTSRPPRRGRVL